MLDDGIHYDIDPRDYHAWNFELDKGPISNSLLKRYANDGPARFREAIIEDQVLKPSAALTWGSLVDCLAFTPDKFEQEFVLACECEDFVSSGAFRTKAARQWRDEVLAGGQLIVTPEEFDAAMQAVKVLNDTPASAKILEGAKAQVGLVYRGEHGVPVKGLVDCLPAGAPFIADLKTTAANIYSDDELSRSIGRLGYHVQASLYLYLWSKLSDEERTGWRIIWQSSSAPYEVRVIRLDNLWRDAGDAFVQYHVPRMVRDITTNHYASVFKEEVTTIQMHNPSVFAEEALVDLLKEVEA